jgi:hypothetical protein
MQCALAAAMPLMLLGGCGTLRAPDPDVVYVAFGDSATRGPAERQYPDVLRALLEIPANQMTNEGHGGETIAAGADRLGDLLADGIYPNAEVLLFWQGGTDLIDLIGELDPFVFWSVHDANYPFANALERRLDRIQSDLEEAVALGRSAGLQVYVATYYPILGGFSSCGAVPFGILLPGQAARANEYVALLNQRIRLTAFASGAVLVDIASQASNISADRDNYEDCNHLSEAGNTIVAGVFRDEIRKRRID